MDCPYCKEPMIVLELSQVEIDYCTECGGIWLDAGELELLMGDVLAKDKVLESFDSDNKTDERSINCPICLKRMAKYSCGIDKKVLVDKCLSDHGIWFDKGELHDIIEMSCFDKDNKVLSLLKDMLKDELSTEN